MNHTLEHPTNPSTALQEWERAVKPLLPLEMQGQWDGAPAGERPALAAKWLRKALGQPGDDVGVPAPPMTHMGMRKLDSLKQMGYRICGYAIQRTEGDWITRGAVTTGGMVLWWHGKLQKPVNHEVPA